MAGEGSTSTSTGLHVLSQRTVESPSILQYPSKVGLELMSTTTVATSQATSIEISGLEVLKYLSHFYLAKDAAYTDLSFYSNKRSLERKRSLTNEQKRNYSLLNTEGDRLFLMTDQFQMKGNVTRHVFSYQLTELDGRLILKFRRNGPEKAKLANTISQVEMITSDGTVQGRVVLTRTQKKCGSAFFYCMLQGDRGNMVGYIPIGTGEGLDYPIFEDKPTKKSVPKLIGQIFVSQRVTVRPMKDSIEDYVLTFYETLPGTLKGLAIGAAILMDYQLSKVKRRF